MSAGRPAADVRHVIRSPRATWRRLPRNVLLAMPGDQAPTRLNSTGALVWDLLGEPRTEAGIVASLAATCQAPPDEVATAVVPLLAGLLACGAIVEVAA